MYQSIKIYALTYMITSNIWCMVAESWIGYIFCTHGSSAQILIHIYIYGYIHECVVIIVCLFNFFRVNISIYMDSVSFKNQAMSLKYVKKFYLVMNIFQKS